MLELVGLERNQMCEHVLEEEWFDLGLLYRDSLYQVAKVKVA